MIIKHGLVVDPASGLSEHMDILVKNGKIARIAPEISEDSEEILEAGGLVVGPGLIDTHVHFRDPGFTYKEDIHTGAKASAKGGFTTVICMANTSPTVDNTDTLKDNLERASKEDIRIRGKVSKTILDVMSDLGLLGDLPESNQLSLFDF